MKSRIIERIGATDVLIASRIAEGLAANDRAKVRMSVLQAAARHAGNQCTPADDLSIECRAAGIDAAEIGTLLAGAHPGVAGAVAAPGLAKLFDALFADIIAMIDAVTAGNPSAGRAARDRLAAMRPKSPTGRDEIAESLIAELTAVPAGGADSVHRLVMDLHKSLNRLSADCAEEIVAVAHAHGLVPADRPIVEAFMSGLDSHARPQIRSSGSRYDRNPRRLTTYYPKRYRNHGCPCPGDHGRGAGNDGHLHRRASCAGEIFRRPVRQFSGDR